MDWVDVCYIWARMASCSLYGHMISKQGLGTKQFRNCTIKKKLNLNRDEQVPESIYF